MHLLRQPSASTRRTALQSPAPGDALWKQLSGSLGRAVSSRHLVVMLLLPSKASVPPPS